MKSTYYLGLDLGQSSDFTALTVLEQKQENATEGGEKPPAQYELRHAARFPLGTPYPQIVLDVCGKMLRDPLPGATLLIDETGCGRPVCDMFKQARPSGTVVPVTITSGNAAKQEGGGWHVAKVQLVSAVQVLLQERRLAWPKNDPVCQVLMKELATFQVKISTAMNEIYGAWREGTHDDLVLSLAMSCWYCQKGKREFVWW